MPSHNTQVDAALALGVGAGLFWFAKGFRVYREYRILADTPEMPIRSIAMGLVEIHGKAKPVETIPSPVTRTPCCFYKVDIERWVRDKNGGRWSHAATEAQGRRFYIEDASGKALVDAQGAELDLLRSGRAETGRGFGGSLARLLKGKGDSPLASGGIVSDSELVAYAHGVVAGKGVTPSFNLQSLLGGTLNLSQGSSDRFRLTEYLILPEHWYDITGTCVENPSPRDEHDRNLIMKGANEPTFLVSWRSEKEIEGTLRRRAALHIFGGGTLSVVCLGILLAKVGWL